MALRLVLALLFFASGLSALVYQLTWMRMLTVVLGTTSFAVSTVLIAFMAGLALGSLFLGRAVDRRPSSSALRVYAGLEFGIAASAALVPVLLDALAPLYVTLYRQLHLSFSALTAVRFGVSLLALSVPTVLMGGTLPVLCRYVARRRGAFGWQTGWLYAVNTLGAGAGCALAGFFLMERLGIRGTMYSAVVVNALVGVAAWLLAARGDAGLAERETEGPDGAVQPVPWARRDRSLALIAVAASGFAGLAYEVLWTRMLVFFLGNTVHAFSIMLITILAGIAAGAALFGRLADRVRRPLLCLAAMQALIGLLALLSTPILCRICTAFAPARSAIHRADFASVGVGFIAAAAGMFLPTLLMGGTLPVVLRIRAGPLAQPGRTVGDAYFCNTAAAAAGPLIAGFLLIPAIGIQGSLFVVACVNLAIAAALACMGSGLGLATRAAAVVLVVAGLCMGRGLSRRDVLRQFFVKRSNARVVAIEQGQDTTVTVSGRGADRFIAIDGIQIAGTRFTMKLRAHLAMLLHPRPRRVLVVGFGSGITFGTVAERYDVKVDCVEISRTVARAGRHFKLWNHDVLEHPRARLIIDDARSYVSCTDKK